MEQNVLSVLIPNYSLNKTTELESRSAIYWPEKVQTPLLFLHGEDDWRVRIEQPKLLIEKLKQLEKPHQFKFYKNGSHDLYSDRMDVFERIHSFFDEYMR